MPSIRWWSGRVKSFPNFPSYGMTAWAVTTEFEPLPSGLPHRSPVQVICRNEADHYLVMDQQGRDWWLPHWKIDSGQSYLLPIERTWVQEMHPAVRSYLSDYAARLVAGGRPEDADEISRIQWILDRSAVVYLFPQRKSWAPSMVSF